jgi:hypothetical protein
MIRGFLGSELIALEVCCKCLVSTSKVLNIGTTTRFVHLQRCCTDANDSTCYAFSSNNRTMLGWSEILRVVGSTTMLLFTHHMWAFNEPPMVGVDKDKPCSQVGDTNYAFLQTCWVQVLETQTMHFFKTCWVQVLDCCLSSQAHFLFAMLHNNGPRFTVIDCLHAWAVLPTNVHLV